eukprot:230752-Rhodomonas_salina.1
MSGTARAIVLRPGCAMSGTEILSFSIALRLCYAMSGTGGRRRTEVRFGRRGGGAAWQEEEEEEREKAEREG